MFTRAILCSPGQFYVHGDRNVYVHGGGFMFTKTILCSLGRFYVHRKGNSRNSQKSKQKIKMDRNSKNTWGKI